jgi:carboxyl-terminal processing protease
VRRPSEGAGRLIELRDAEGRLLKVEGHAGKMAWNGPLVVLMSKFSASASEILAGAVQDYHRGLIIGDHATHGKGTVQSLIDIGDRAFRFMANAPSLGALKITKQQFYRPGGDSTQKRGVLSDIELPSLTTHLDIAEADLDYPVEFDQVDPLDFERSSLVDKHICRELARLSHERMAESEDFQKLTKDIARYKELKNRKYVSLNEEKFLAERKELDAEKAEEEQIDQINDPDAPVIERDYYFNEALAITLDYLAWINGGRTKLADRMD